MELTAGAPRIKIGLIDGPVALDHSDLDNERIIPVSDEHSASCNLKNSAACIHGTFIAGILSAKRSSDAPALCPDSTLLVRPIFSENSEGDMPSTNPFELASAIVDCVDSGAVLINLSSGISDPTPKGKGQLLESLEYASAHGVLVIAAAGNQGVVGGSAITSHPWVIPVAACDFSGKPMNMSNLGRRIGRQGLRAPGANLLSLGSQGESISLEGTSVACPLVTGTIVLLWSLFPTLSSSDIKYFMTNRYRQKTVVPPLLDAWATYLEVKRYFMSSLND